MMTFRLSMICGIILFVSSTVAVPVVDDVKEDSVIAIFNQASTEVDGDFKSLGRGYCVDDSNQVMPNYQKYTGTSGTLNQCKQYCKAQSGCVGLSYAQHHSVGSGLCQLHGAQTGPDPSWQVHAAGSPATTITKATGPGNYECVVKDTPPKPKCYYEFANGCGGRCYQKRVRQCGDASHANPIFAFDKWWNRLQHNGGETKCSRSGSPVLTLGEAQGCLQQCSNAAAFTVTANGEGMTGPSKSECAGATVEPTDAPTNVLTGPPSSPPKCDEQALRQVKMGGSCSSICAWKYCADYQNWNGMRKTQCSLRLGGSQKGQYTCYWEGGGSYYDDR